MASITIMHSHKNLIFAANVANETGAEFEEDGQYIRISDTPELTIPNYCFRDAMGRRDYDPRQESAWRSLLLNKRGYLKYFGEDEIVISDDKPQEKRPSYLLRFDSDAQKSLAEKYADEMGYGDLREYLIAAIETFNREWSRKVQDAMESGGDEGIH